MTVLKRESEMFSVDKGLKNAAVIGSMSVGTYIINYYLRNLLSVLNPQLLETGNYSVDFLALLSSVYMFFYAAGQLFNGILGDRVSPKKMISTGTAAAGIAMCLFPFVKFKALQVFCFVVLGFALSMLRGPLMKTISENTKPDYARVICVFFSMAGFLGPLVASIFAMIFAWNWAFVAAGAFAVICAILVYIILSNLEKHGFVKYSSTKGEGFGAIIGIFKIEKIGFYMIVAALVEICASSISFWLPTLFTSELGFGKDFANMLFSGISVARALMPFVALIIFKLIKERDIAMLLVTFGIAALCFALMTLAPNRWILIILLVPALMACSCSAALLWSIYIPSLGKTGKVSSINGVIDCFGYIMASLANMFFALISGKIGWNGVYLMWSGIALVGVLSALFVGNKKAK